jgi:hypothetical protein
MSTQLIRMTAKDIAGAFNESHERTFRFRTGNPDQDAFVAQYWPHHVQLAKKALIELMTRPDTPQHMKDAIEEELIDDFNRSQGSGAREVLQVSSDSREREDIRHIDNSPQLLKVGM